MKKDMTEYISDNYKHVDI